MKAKIRVFLLVGMLGLISKVYSKVSNIEFSGDARIRSEWLNNSSLDTTPDRISYTQSRFRLNAKGLIPDGHILLQPRFTKIMGQKTTEGVTSGSLRDTDMQVHQAYIQYELFNSGVELKVGRQEMAYGDHLLIGNVGWSNVGRSFDSIKLMAEWSKGFSTDVFVSKIEDTNISSRGSGDHNFYGLYNSMSFGKFLKEADVYLFSSEDHTQENRSDDETLYSTGLRLKSNIDGILYRVEVTGQKGKTLGNVKTQGHQFNIEGGYTAKTMNLKVSAQYFQASENYRQLYPTAHKWLGYADVLSRRNLRGFAGHFKISPYDGLTLGLDYHQFALKKKGKPAYNFAGTSHGTPVDLTADSVGSEYDVSVKLNLNKHIKVLGGYSIFRPGNYFKKQSKKEDKEWSYLGLEAYF